MEATSTSTPSTDLKSNKNGQGLRRIGTSPLFYRDGVLLASNKNWTGGKMVIKQSNYQQYSDGSLLRAFHKLDSLPTDQATIGSLELQTAIYHELEDRGWQFDEEENDFTIAVNERNSQ